METYILTKKFSKGFAPNGNPPVYFTREIGEYVEGEVIRARKRRQQSSSAKTFPKFLRVPFIVYGQNRYVDIPMNMLRPKKAYNENNNEIKSSFDSNLNTKAKYKVKQDVTSSKGAKFFKDEVVEGTPSTTLKDFVNVERKNDWGDTKNDLIIGFDIEKVDDSTPLTKPSDFTGAMKESEKAEKTLTILSSIGALAGLYYAYSKKKGFWGYVAPMVLGGIVGSLVANVVTKMKKPKLSNDTKKESTSKNTFTSTKPLESSSNVKTTSTTNVDTSKMSKAQKIDLIVSTMSDPEQKDMDAFNKKFISTLNDAELNTWIKLSKALKDKDLQNAQTSTNEQEAKKQLYKILSTKYKISQKEFDTSMKKFGEALINDFEKGIKEGLTQATEQVFEKGMTEQKHSMFSNFESSLDLDL